MLKYSLTVTTFFYYTIIQNIQKWFAGIFLTKAAHDFFIGFFGDED